MRMLWIHLTSKSSYKKGVSIDASRILEMNRYGKSTRLTLDREGQDTYVVYVRESPHEIVEMIKKVWHYEYGPGSIKGSTQTVGRENDLIRALTEAEV